jgi:hypothetical protein
MEPVFERGSLTFVICVTETIPLAFSNLLQVYKMEFQEKFTRIYAKPIDSLSASPLERDTFYATNMLAIPDSGLLILTLENSGALLLNITCLEKDRFNDETPPL